MTFIWLFIWLIKGTPTFAFDQPSSWAIGLFVCVLLDLMNIPKKVLRR